MTSKQKKETSEISRLYQISSEFSYKVERMKEKKQTCIFKKNCNVEIEKENRKIRLKYGIQVGSVDFNRFILRHADLGGNIRRQKKP